MAYQGDGFAFISSFSESLVLAFTGSPDRQPTLASLVLPKSPKSIKTTIRFGLYVKCVLHCRYRRIVIYCAINPRMKAKTLITAVAILTFLISLNSVLASTGANVPWITYEAENMTNTGVILGPSYAGNN